MTSPTLSLQTEFGDLTAYGEDPTPQVQRGTSSPQVPGFVADAATLTGLLLDNISRDLDPQNAGSPFAGLLRPKVPTFLTATWGETLYYLFDGRADGFPQSYPSQGVEQYVELTATDFFQYFANTPINTSRPAEKTGARIQAVLDSIGLPSWIGADIAPGMSTVYGQDLQTVAALSHLGDVAQVEYGELYYSPVSSTIVFRDRAAIATDARSTEVQAEYVQTGGLNFVDIQRVDLPIINYVVLTYGADGRQVTVSDATSITAYDQQATSISLPFETASQARCYGMWLLLLYAQPRSVIQSVTFEPLNEPGDEFDLWADLLSRQEGDLVQVTLDPLNAPYTLSGDPIVETGWVRGISFDFMQPQVTLTLQPSWVEGLFFWDTSELDGPDYYGL